MRWRNCLGSGISGLRNVKMVKKAASSQQGRAAALVGVRAYSREVGQA